MSDKTFKILIFISAVAILISAYILNIKPYIAELSKRDRDQIRIGDLSLIDSAINKLRNTNSNIFLGETNKVYISIPSPKSNCEDLELPSLPENWEYRCKSKSDYQKIDGNGWIPVDFTKLSDNELKSSLPTDSDGGYYSYVTGEKNDFIVTSPLESDKFLKKTALNDSGTDPVRLEVGSDLQLWAKVSGLVGYWNFDEGEGEIAKDLSGNGNDGILINAPAWVNEENRKVLSFDGIDDYINIPINIEAKQNKISTSVWVYVSSLPTEQKGIMNGSGYSNHLWLNTDGTISYGAWTTITNYQASTINKIIPGQWNQIALVIDFLSGHSRIYINGDLAGSSTLTGNSISIIFFEIGRHPNNDFNYFEGLIDEARIYNRILKEQEIQKSYFAKNL